MAAGFVVETKEMRLLLLVEDKQELRAMLKKALERAGYTVDEAPDGAAAIRRCAREISAGDYGFEDAGGFGAGHFARDEQADATVPVLLLTAYGSVEEAVRR